MPIQLKKRAVAPLLGTLNGKPRGVVSRPAPVTIRAPRSSKVFQVAVSSEEDVEREPATSSDEEEIQPLLRGTSVRNDYSPFNRGGTSLQGVVVQEKDTNGRAFAAGAKRKRDRSPAKVQDEDEAIFGSTWSSQRSQRGYGKRGKGSQNIHIIPSSNGDKASSSNSTAKNGSCFISSSQALYNTDGNAGSGFVSFKKPRGLSLESTEVERPVFKYPRKTTQDSSLDQEDDKIVQRNGRIRHSTVSHPSFKTPTADITFKDTGSTSGLSSPPSSPQTPNGQSVIDIRSSPPLAIYDYSPSPAPEDNDESGLCCPICFTPVTSELFDTLTMKRPQTTRDKMNFCTNHKRLAALAKYSRDHYPAIDWEALPARLKRHDAILEAVLSGRRPSHYRTQLESHVASVAGRKGFHRKDAFGAQNAVPGYYGPRGARHMLEHVMSVFAPKIRKIAAETEAVGVTGVTGYLQAVLVPEMAVCLVKEDMDCGDEEARRVLEESAEVGELMHGEEEERVMYLEDAEEMEDVGG